MSRLYVRDRARGHRRYGDEGQACPDDVFHGFTPRVERVALGGRGGPVSLSRPQLVVRGAAGIGETAASAQRERPRSSASRGASQSRRSPCPASSSRYAWFGLARLHPAMTASSRGPGTTQGDSIGVAYGGSR